MSLRLAAASALRFAAKRPALTASVLKKYSTTSTTTEDDSKFRNLKNLIHTGELVKIRKYFEQDARYQIPYTEYLRIAKEVFGLEEQAAIEYLKNLHSGGVILHFSDDKILQSTVIIKPEVITSSLYKYLDLGSLERETDAKYLELHNLRNTLEPLDDTKAKLDAIASRTVDRWVWVGMIYLLTQSALLARLTWWDWGWDVVEPISYFVTFGGVLLGYTYFIKTKGDLTFEEARKRMEAKRRAIQYQKHGFDLNSYLALKQHEKALVELVEKNSKLLWGVVPEKYSALHELAETSTVFPPAAELKSDATKIAEAITQKQQTPA